MIFSPQNLLGLLLGAIVICSQAEDTCPESDTMEILRGYPGTPGHQGPQGPPGLQGHKGDEGAPGKAGDIGLSGEKGDKGAPGNMGTIGKKGDQGAQGKQGNRGLTGEKGIQGAQGRTGERGITGAKGEQGAPGRTGDKGLTGQKGDQGAQGRTGDRGLTGVKGSKGEKGDSFSAIYGGDKGAPGITGGIPGKKAKDCKALRGQGVLFSGWYTIYPDGMPPLMVRCDMTTDGGGWIVFQRRVDGSVNFYQNWATYKRGFGSQLSEFWLGNENIHRLTSGGNFVLRIDLEDFDNVRAYAAYEGFSVAGEGDFYKLNLGKFIEGTAGDSFTYHRAEWFSTYDKDKDKSGDIHCAQNYMGGYWYYKCVQSNLNGLYLRGQRAPEEDGHRGISWQEFKGKNYSLKMSEMKFRPKQ